MLIFVAAACSKLPEAVKETTWVHKIFGGKLRSRVHCLTCQHNSDTFDSVLDLSIEIFKQRSLKDALNAFVAIEKLDGKNLYNCEKCKKPVRAEKQFTIHEAPQILTVHLKRFTPLGRKLTQPINYPEQLSLKGYMSDGQVCTFFTLLQLVKDRIDLSLWISSLLRTTSMVPSFTPVQDLTLATTQPMSSHPKTLGTR